MLMKAFWILGAVLVQKTFCQGEDYGLVVSLLPDLFSQNAGELVTFPGRVDSFGQQGKIDSRYYYFFENTDVLSMACDPRDNTVYLMDGYTQSLYKMTNFNIWLNDTRRNVSLLHQGISYTSSVQIAFDWLSKNIYWTDELYNWIAVQPVDTTDRTMFKVILHEKLNKPSAIAVDPVKGLLFWSEQSTAPVIEQSSLTGEDRRVILTGVSMVPDIVLDTQEERLYWIDIGRNSLESAKYDGSDRRLVQRSTNINLYMNGVTLYKNVVCISEYKENAIECLDKNSGAVVWSYRFRNQQPWAVEVYDQGVQNVVKHDCKNYGCKHFCVNTPDGAQCMCKEGFVLSTDNKTCETRHNLYGKGLIIANGTDFCMLDIRVITSHIIDPRCFFRWTDNITFIAVDATRNFIFFADDLSNSLKKLDINTNATHTLTSFSQISGLAFDWISYDIYWADSAEGKIKVAPTDNRLLLDQDVFTNIYSPTYLTIDPHNFTLYWISNIASMYRIEGGSFDGRTRWTVISSPTLQKPTGLYFDITYNRLFWINNGEMRSIMPDGTGMLRFHTVGTSSEALLYKDYALVSSGQDTIMVSNIHSSSSEISINITQFGSVAAMAVFDPSTQRSEKGPCETTAAGCEHICIPEANNKYTCRCGFGFTVNSDQHNCSSTSMLDDFALVVDLTHGIFYQVALSDASIVAVDIPFPNYPKNAVYEPTHQHIYWTDFRTNQILRSTIHGTNKSVVFNAGMYMPNGITLDPSTGNIYYSASILDAAMNLFSYIGVFNPHSGQHLVLISELTKVTHLVLHPAKGWLFWIDTGSQQSPGYIGKASMDSENRVYLVSNDLYSPTSLAIDYIGERLYWTDSYTDEITSVNFEGGDRRMLMHDPMAKLSQITIAGSHIYYTATNRQYITKINKDTGTIASWMKTVPEFGRLESIQIYPGDKVPVHANCSVNNGLCSTFCLPTPFGRTCACEDGIAMTGDGRTCQGVKKCPEKIPNGFLSPSCSAYLGSSCTFTCASGFIPKHTRDIHCTDSGNWDWNPKSLCQKIRGGQDASSSKMTGDSQANTGLIVGVILGVGALLIIIGLILLIMYRRRAGMFNHAKFVNSPNVQLNPSSAENVYSGADDNLAYNPEKIIVTSNPGYGNNTIDNKNVYTA